MSIDREAQEKIFLEIRNATDRKACEQWLKAQDINSDNAADIETAKQRWRALPFLLHPDLYSLALDALKEARGRIIDERERFHATIWPGGATDTHNGRAFLGRYADFVTLLHERAQRLAPKREGWVIEPTITTDGRRTNASTLSMHAMFLDCDGSGSWDKLIEVLTHLNFAFVAYQSGGWTPVSPKWRIVLPLSQPFNTRTKEAIATWKTLYGHARVVFGAVGTLIGEGFDPTTETPCIPWFMTERRAATDLPRQVIWRAGHSLDLMSLAMALPAIEEEQKIASGPRNVKSLLLDAAKLEKIIDALTVAMSRHTSSRRDLYLALTGVLCDRGMADDAVDIIEEISLRVPGEQNRHGEHVHCARTTVECFRAGKPHTQIGTLNERWPDVAAIIDEVLPNVLEQALRTLILGTSDAPVAPPPPPMTGSTLAPPPPPPSFGVNTATVLAKVRQAIRKKRNAKSAQAKLDGDMIENFMAGEAIISPAEMQRTPALSIYDGEKGLQRVVLILGNALTETLPWEAIVHARPQLSRVTYDQETLMRMGKIFTSAQTDKIAWKSKKAADKAAADAMWKERVDAEFTARAAARAAK